MKISNRNSIKSIFKKAAIATVTATTVALGAVFLKGDKSGNESSTHKVEEGMLNPPPANNGHSHTPKYTDLDVYVPSAFTTDDVSLNFDIHEDSTLVTSTVTYKRTAHGHDADELVLDVSNPNSTEDFIRSVKVNGKELAAGTGYVYDSDKEELRIPIAGHDDDIRVETTTYLEPDENKDLRGLYNSGSLLITQSESENFRRITPMLDRPDIQARYRVRLEASKDHMPVLMAGGDRESEETLPNNRHAVTFYDDTPKPSYLFAVAGGDMDIIEGVYTTGSGRNVDLRIFTEKGKGEQGRFAIETLKEIMAWHEEVYDVEYERDSYNIVAAPEFEAGAMENTGLNIFLEKTVLIDPKTATNDDHYRVASVLAHEFMHHRSGNHVTIRDFFNVVAKEGLTTTREQDFMAAMTSEDYERINTVDIFQYLMNRGSTATSIMKKQANDLMDLYSGANTYQKGSETFHMMRVMMGNEKFVEGLKNYFEKYDGQSVTLHELVSSMEEVSGLDLSGQFMRWYTQPGKVNVSAQGKYDPVKKTYSLSLEQSAQYIQGAKGDGKPFYIPVAVELVDDQGNNMPLTLKTDAKNSKAAGATERVLHFTKSKQVFVFENVAKEPAFHSVMDHFSAPVAVNDNLSKEQLYQRFFNDNDMVDRWQAGKDIINDEAKRLYSTYQKTGQMPDVDPLLVDAMGKVLQDTKIDPAVKSTMLQSLNLWYIEEDAGEDFSDRSILAKVSGHMMKTVGTKLYNELADVYKDNYIKTPVEYNYETMGKLEMFNIAKSLIKSSGQPLPQIVTPQPQQRKMNTPSPSI